MEEHEGFYTLKGYQVKSENEMTAAMEDYLEMILRTVVGGQRIRVGDISKNLHVKPPSVTKMISHLCTLGYISSEKYGEIMLTEKGMETGNYLLERHHILNEFLCLVNKSDNELEQVEKIEHFIDKRTVQNIRLFLEKAKNEPPQ